MTALALVLLLQGSPAADAVRDLESPDLATREAAADRLLALDEEAILAIREALARTPAGTAQIEAQSRLRDILDRILPIRATLTIGPARVGEPLAWSVRLANGKERPVVLSRVKPGSERHRIYPRFTFEAVDPDGTPVAFAHCACCDSADLPPATAADFADVEPGEEFDPFGGDAALAHDFGLWRPDRGGTYRVRFVYDSSSGDAGEWTVGRAMDGETTARFLAVHHERIASEWVEVAVAGR